MAMKNIIEGIRFHPVIHEKSHYLTCLSSLMNVLSYHNGLFQNTRTFDLLRLGWTMRYDVKKQILLAGSTQAFLSNLNDLFGVEIEKKRCRNFAQFKDYCGHKLIEQHCPLFIFVQGVPEQENRRLIFSEDRTLHCGYAVYGLDLEQNRMLMLTNQMRLLGWSEMETVFNRLDRKLIFDTSVPDHVQMPSKRRIADHLLKIVASNLYPLPFLCRVKNHLKTSLQKFMGKLSCMDLPLLGTVIGPESIRVLASDIMTRKGRFGSSVEDTARAFCRRTLTCQTERANFISILIEDSSLSENREICREILRCWKEVEALWGQASRGFAGFYMSGSKQRIAGLEETLISLALAEETFLKSVRDYSFRP